MAITLPLPVRVAAGILATGIDLVKSLPDDIPAIPVTLVGNAMRLSMKVQQEIATLATRGDELLGGVIGAPQENPAWATFDDDEPAKPVTGIKPAVAPRSTSTTRPRPGTTRSKPAAAPAKAPVTTPPHLVAGPADSPALSTPETTAMPPVTTTAMDAALSVTDALVESATVAADDRPSSDPATTDPTSGTEKLAAAHQKLDAEEEAALGAFEAGQVPDEVLESVVIGETEELTEGLDVPAELIDEILTETLTEGAPADGGTAASVPTSAEEEAQINPVDGLLDAEIDAELRADATDVTADGDQAADEADGAGDNREETNESDEDGPAALPGYDRMTLAQVRGHLRELTSADVTELLRYEQSGDNRAPFLTLLSNRLVTLDAQNS
jgi:hypothetical protein